MWQLIYLSFGIFAILALLIPKTLNGIEIYATSVFALLFGLTADMILGLYFGLYGYFDGNFQWFVFFAVMICFLSISLLFLNLYPIKSSKWIKILYVVGWSIFSLTFEWFCLYTHFFFYNGWRFWYSAIAYPIIFSILLLNLKVIRKLNKQNKSTSRIK